MSELVTGDAVVLDVKVAQLPVRVVSAFIDIFVQMIVLYGGIFVVAFSLSQFDAALTGALSIVYSVLALVGYPVIWEMATRGRSLGKMAMGLRVVSDDGGPERLRQAVIRALSAVVEIFMFMGAPAVIASLASTKGKRLGDIFAGTMVISERGPKLPPPPMMPPQLAQWAQSLQLSGLTSDQADLARQFLNRAGQLAPSRGMRARSFSKSPQTARTLIPGYSATNASPAALNTPESTSNGMNVLGSNASSSIRVFSEVPLPSSTRVSAPHAAAISAAWARSSPASVRVG